MRTQLLCGKVRLTPCSFHFDTQDAGRPCEAAFLSSPSPALHLNNASLPQVTVLCSYVRFFCGRIPLTDYPLQRPSNFNRRRRAYASLVHVRVEPLYLSEKDLTADRMLAIMGCDNLDVRLCQPRQHSGLILCWADDAAVHAHRLAHHPQYGRRCV